MLSPSDFNNAVPQFTNGTYASNPINPQYVNEPTSTEYNQGVEPLQTLPAQWWNWFINKFTGRFNKINTYVKNIFNELTELLSLSNITPDGTEATPTTCQLKDMFASCYPDYVKCCTTGTACGCIPVIGSELCCEANHIVVTDANGNLKPTSFTVGTAAGCDASCFMPAGVASCSSYLFCCYTVGDTPATFREFCKYVCIYDDECVSVINLRGCSYHGRRYCWECVPINVDSACYSCTAVCSCNAKCATRAGSCCCDACVFICLYGSMGCSCCSNVVGCACIKNNNSFPVILTMPVPPMMVCCKITGACCTFNAYYEIQGPLPYSLVQVEASGTVGLRYKIPIACCRCTSCTLIPYRGLGYINQ